MGYGPVQGDPFFHPQFRHQLTAFLRERAIAGDIEMRIRMGFANLGKWPYCDERLFFFIGRLMAPTLFKAWFINRREALGIHPTGRNMKQMSRTANFL